jgi:two-component system LytT family response regulator
MIKAIIIDDDITCISTLHALVQKFCPTVSIVGTGNTVNDAVILIANYTPDIVFLDVEMQGELGFDLLTKFNDPTFEIIFTTAHEKYALTAIKNSCLEYLLKPIDYIELQSAIAKFKKKDVHLSRKQNIEVLLAALNNKTTIATKIIIPSVDSHSFVHTNDIVCCNANANYTNVYTTQGEKITSTKSLKEFDETLGNTHFFRCHKSWLINLNEIKKYLKNENQIVMRNDILVEVSFRKKEEFLNLFKKI